MQRVGGEVREVIERDGIVTQCRDLRCEGTYVRLDLRPLGLHFLAGGFQVDERDFRPVNPLLRVATEKRADGIDEEKLHEVVAVDRRKSVWWGAALGDGVVTFESTSGGAGERGSGGKWDVYYF